MAEIGSAKFDVDRRDKGVWCPFFEDVEILIASIQSKDYQAFLRKASKQRRGFRAREMSEQENLRITKIGFSRHIILDWKNITENGVEIPYSEEKALEYLTDDEFSDFYQFACECATDVARFQRQNLEEKAGNSPSSSDGNSSTANT